jgi:hypothetical protein
MKKIMMCVVLLIAMATMNAGCSDSGGHTDDNAPAATEQEFVDRAINDWLDVDFSFNTPDGTGDTDGDGRIDTDDAVNFIETFKALGYDIPETTIDGLHDNYYTVFGYTHVDSSYNISFSYTLDSPVTQTDLQNHDWSGLEIGDLIFLDYDMDYSWDNCAIYIGAYGSYTHAVLLASDYYDKVVISDLDWDDEIIVLDIDYGFSDVRKPDLDHFADYY